MLINEKKLRNLIREQLILEKKQQRIIKEIIQNDYRNYNSLNEISKEKIKSYLKNFLIYGGLSLGALPTGIYSNTLSVINSVTSTSEQKIDALKSIIKAVNENNNLPDNIIKQVAVINSNRDQNDINPFIVIDDQNKMLYVFNPDYSLKSKYPVITGENKGDEDTYDFYNWLKSKNAMSDYEKESEYNKNKYFNAFLNDRKDLGKRITPKGVYTITKIKDFTDQDNAKSWHANSYGKRAKLSVMPGVKPIVSKPITIAFHGTGKSDRIKNLSKAEDIMNAPYEDQYNVSPESEMSKTSYLSDEERTAAIRKSVSSSPSYGCINLTDENLDKLINDIHNKEKQIQVYIMSDEGDGVFYTGYFDDVLVALDKIESSTGNAVYSMYQKFKNIFKKPQNLVDFNSNSYLKFTGQKTKNVAND